MKLAEFRRLMSPGSWIAAGVAVLLIAGFGWWVLTEPGRANQRAADARAEAALGGSRTVSAQQAAVTLDQAHTAAAAAAQLSRESADVIQAAPGADQALDPRLNRTGRQRLCLRDAYRHRPECLQQPGGAEPPG